MTDVFISYRREDKARATALAEALKLEALDVWWDQKLEAGQAFDAHIQEMLQKAKAVIVCWSPAAVASEWVRGEATIGRERGVLAPVLVAPVAIPVPFNLIHTIDLSKWNGDRADPAYRALVARLKELANKKGVKPLRPPPSRALRGIVSALVVIGALAAAGASLWWLRPWEQPAAAIAEAAPAEPLEAYGVSMADLRDLDWKVVAGKRFRPATVEALTAAADGGDGHAQALLCAVRYWGAAPVSADDAAAERYCRLSAEGGNPAGQVYYGYLFRDQEQHEESAKWYKAAAEQGWPWAQVQLGALYENGLGVPSDLIEAVNLYRAAAAQSHPPAWFNLGQCYLAGWGVERDHAEAARLWRQASDAGVAVATLRLAELLAEGSASLPPDAAEARRLFTLAAADPDNSISGRARSGLEALNEAEQGPAVDPAAE